MCCRDFSITTTVRMRDCNVIATSGPEEETPDNDVKCIYKEVVVVGNGPSGITLSYLLSGHRPYYNRIPHPDPMLSARLIECTQKSLLHQDLSFLSQGIEGRSKNPISLLIDAMSHPGADMGLEWPSLLTWKKTAKNLDHIVLGKGDPGGTWPGIADHILTISPGRWMALPGLEFKEYHDKRAPASAVAKYYKEYVKKNDLAINMAPKSMVTMIQPIICKSRRRARWKVWVSDTNGGTVSYECRHLVLATGSSDKAGCLGVPGESFSFVNHDLKNFEEHLSSYGEKTLAMYKPDVTPQVNESSQNLPSTLNGKNKTLLKAKSNGYPYSKESKYWESLSSTENVSKRFLHSDSSETVSENLWLEGLEKGYQDVKTRMKQVQSMSDVSDIERHDYSNEFLNKHKQISAIKTSENAFKEVDSIYFAHDIPKEKEVDLPLSELDIRNEEFAKDKGSPFFMEGMGEEVESHEDKKVLVVGAGLSAADAILAAWSKNFYVFHAFRSPLMTTQLPSTMYPEYHELYKLMQGLATRKDYQSLPGHQVTEINMDNTVHLADSSGNKKTLKVFSVAILIGSQPDLFFLPKTLKNLGIDVNKPIDCKVNPIQIDPFIYKCVRAPPGLYALGPLVGDNFVRFLLGGALAIAGHIFKDNNLHKDL